MTDILSGEKPLFLL